MEREVRIKKTERKKDLRITSEKVRRK